MSAQRTQIAHRVPSYLLTGESLAGSEQLIDFAEMHSVFQQQFLSPIFISYAYGLSSTIGEGF